MERTLRETEGETEDPGLLSQAGTCLIAHYREQKIELRCPTEAGAERSLPIDAIERGLRLLALDAEREALYRIARSGELADERVRDLVREVDLQESWFSVRGSRS